jgi:hypothetical protein
MIFRTFLLHIILCKQTNPQGGDIQKYNEMYNIYLEVCPQEQHCKVRQGLWQYELPPSVQNYPGDDISGSIHWLAVDVMSLLSAELCCQSYNCTYFKTIKFDIRNCIYFETIKFDIRNCTFFWNIKIWHKNMYGIHCFKIHVGTVPTCILKQWIWNKNMYLITTLYLFYIQKITDNI